MMLTRRSLKCLATSQKPQNNITVARKAFESRRFISVKENFNKLVLIATSDTKEISDFMKELDLLHKKHFEKTPTTPTTSTTDESSSDENIFLE